MTKVLQEDEVLRYRHLRVRLTPLGWGMFLMVTVIVLAAINFGVNLAYGLAFWLLGFSVWAMLSVIFQVYGMRMVTHCTDECFAGERVPISISSIVSASKSPRVWVGFEKTPFETWVLMSKDAGASVDTKPVADIKLSAILPFLTTRRGYARLPKILIYSHAPFALLSVEVILNPKTVILVYPEPKDAESFDVASVGGQDTAVSSRNGAQEMAYLRAYETGDAFHHIAWKEYAKTTKLMTKVRDDGVSVRAKRISYRDYPAHTAADLLASFLCCRVLNAHKTEQYYELELPGQLITPQWAQRRVALSALALMKGIR